MRSQTEQPADFGGLVVVSFESRRAKEMATLISNYGGIPLVAPSMREIPLEENPAVFAFAERLFAKKLDAVIFMTGVGTQTLLQLLEVHYPREKIVGALAEIRVVARGPKPIKVLKELRIPITISVPEPNTWREILHALEENAPGFKLEGSRVAVQEYGVSNPAFLEQLRRRGADALRVPVYRWCLPEDTAPLRKALEAILEARARLVLFTNAVQVEHVLQVAAEHGLKQRLLEMLRSCVVCSVGPTCSEALLAAGTTVDLEPEHGRMGLLVHEAARKAPDLLRHKTNR
jgi:uroporphyrinogen-III synthase